MSLKGFFNLTVCIVFGVAAATAGAVTYTCDSTVASIDGSGVCAYLNSDVAAIYNNLFTNANANIYITTSTTGLGASAQFLAAVSYSQYYSALSGESTDTTAVASLPPTDPSAFSSSSQDVVLTDALTTALGFSGTLTGESPGAGGTNPTLSACVLGSANCYNGVIEIVTPSGLSAETSGTQGLWFRNVAGTASGPQPGNDYDYFTVVEHETDEILGTASCADVNSGPTISNGCTIGGHPTPSAVDLFRYSAPGTRVFDSTTSAYFSPNGGTTDTDGNHYNSTVANEDYADFSSNCTFVQDATGCLGGSSDITNDYIGGAGPEVQILNAVGYNLAPEPGTVALSAAGLAGIGWYRRRRRA